MPESWRETGYLGYQASNLGRIRGPRGIRKLRVGPKGYVYISIRIPGFSKPQQAPVHVLVCQAFHGPRPGGKEVAHGNGVRTDNRPENLRWATRKENHEDRVKSYRQVLEASRG